MKNFRSEFLKIFNKTADYDKSKGIHLNGIGNNYPDFVESIISESVTASRCAKLMADYISGKGFEGDANKLIVNESKETTLLKFTQNIAESIAEHNGVYIHCNYNGEFNIKNMEVLPFADCRVGKKDDDDYFGKILVCDDWGDAKKVKKATPIDVYNSNKEVIQKQIEASKGINDYNGQIMYFRFGKYTYPLAPIHPCLKDAESETQVAVYKHISLKKGFFGKTIIATKPLVDANVEDDEYETQITQREAFKTTIKEFIGAENADGVLHLEMDFDSEKLKDQLVFENINSNIDDKLFAHTENSVSDNIRMCFNNVPVALIRSQDGKIFGTSGNAIKEMKIFYQDQTKEEQMIVEEIINKLMKSFKDPQTDLKIVPLIEETLIPTSITSGGDSPELAKKKAQATLKGSVGGVTALLQIQQSVSAGTTDRDAAITIIEEIYGIDKTLASEMLGTPNKEVNVN